MSINPRLRHADNNGWQPCIDPVVLGRVMDRLCEDRAPSAIERIAKALANLRKKLAR